MRNLFFILAMALLSLSGFSQTTNTKPTVLVYFFHGTHRCAGCVNAEKATVTALNMLYKEQLDKGVIKFESINVEEEKNKALAEKYEAAWNKLLFVNANNTKQQYELTEQSFSLSGNTDELGKIVKATVEKIMK